MNGIYEVKTTFFTLDTSRNVIIIEKKATLDWQKRHRHMKTH